MGEESYKKDTPFLYTEAGRFKTSQQLQLQSDAGNFVLPSNIRNVIEQKSVMKDTQSKVMLAQDCYESHVVNFKKNPYVYGSGKHTKVRIIIIVTAIYISPSNMRLLAANFMCVYTHFSMYYAIIKHFGTV